MKRIQLIVVLLSVMLLMLGKPSQAQNQLQLQWTMLGPGKFIVEFYRVGDRAPLNLYTTPRLQHSWTAAFNIPPDNGWRFSWFFLRVTNLDTRQTKQTLAFCAGGFYPNIGLNWNKNFLGPEWAYDLIIDGSR